MKIRKSYYDGGSIPVRGASVVQGGVRLTRVERWDPFLRAVYTDLRK